MKLNELETGDILLFDPSATTWYFTIFDMGIRYFTKSKYTHTAVVLKDPKFISNSLKGLFMWESSYEGTPDPQDGKVKLGVQITPLVEFFHNYQGKVYVRKLLTGKQALTQDRLKEIHEVVYDKPYDIIPSDWINAISRKDNEPQKTSRFWCSALVSYILVKIGFLQDSVDWSIVRPSDLSSHSSYLEFINCDYGEDCLLNVS